MCSICLRNPCDSRCPNAPEPEPVHTCSDCGCGIFEGDKFFEGPDGCICEECLSNMTAKEVLELIGETLRTA